MVTTRERIGAAIVGAFAGDAASMGVHWIYDPSKLIETLGDAKGAPEYQPQPPSPGFYSPAEFPGHYGSGQLSPFGEQLEFVTNYSRDLITSGKTSIDPRHMTVAFKDWAETFGGRKDHGTLGTLENIATDTTKGGKDYYGANDDQSHAFTKAVPVTCMFFSRPSVDPDLSAAIRVHQDNDTAVAIGHAASVLLKSMLQGKGLPESLTVMKEWAAKKKDQDSSYTVAFTAIVNAEKFAADGLDPEGVIVALGGENVMYNRGCKLPPAFVLPLFLMYRLIQSDGYQNKLTSDHFVQLLRENMMVGGDTCGRSIFLGAVLAAGLGAVPESFLTPMDPEVKSRVNAAAATIASFGAGGADEL